ncbi:MAG TPA: metalloregulator ArsR/SmtB family transcription factor [Pyrinomonadaceae bacterium]|nr:metalloregulator ArsR/SmtB family transcription factor [Pyrinomonadaceae bacterium]
MGKKTNFDLELFFAALADKTRLRLLNLMREGEVCVCFFAGTLDTNNPKVSRHLSYLKRAGLVDGRRDGKWMHYRIRRPENPLAAEVFDATMKLLAADDEMNADIRQYADFCCSPNAPVTIVGRAKVTA